MGRTRTRSPAGSARLERERRAGDRKEKKRVYGWHHGASEERVVRDARRFFF